jgi:hypothetical protein
MDSLMDYQEFLKDIEYAISVYEAANGHAAIITREMIQTQGEIEALSRLMISGDLQQGFRVLRDTGQLNKTFESIVVKYKDFFTSEVVDAAKWRLENANNLL